MAGLCERCMEREARSPHDLYCDPCEQAMKMTPEEHELLVASVPPKGYSGGQLIPCDECGQYFRTTDWPPAICRDCRKKQ